MKSLRKLLHYCSVIFTKDENLAILYLSFFAFVLASMEIITIGGLIPFINMFARGETNFNNRAFQEIINRFNFMHVKNTFLLIGIVLIVVSTLKIFLNMLYTYLQAKFATKVQTRLSVLLLNNYASNDYIFHINANSSVLLKNVMVETSNIYFFVTSLMRMISNVILVGGILLLLLYVNYRITLFTIIFFAAVIFLIVKLNSQRVKVLGNERENINKLTYKLAHQILTGIKEIKINKAEDFFIGKFFKIASRLVPVSSSFITLSASPRFILELFIYSGAILILMVIAHFFGVNRSLFGLLAAYVAAVYKLAPAFSNISTSAIEIRYAVPTLEIISSSIKESRPTTGVATRTYKEKVNFTDHIKLLNVGYSYNSQSDNNEVLKSVNLTIDKNDKIVIVGESGVGKSTLVNIITGLLKPSYGEILFDGESIDELNTSALSKILGYIPQDAIILDENIIANIAFGLSEEKVDEGRIKEILKIVRLEKFCEDLNYQVGEDGSMLSGGERQRIIIGRILYKDPEIVILDEITSALDSKTELNVIEDILNIFSNKTILAVTHSKNLIEKFVIVYRLENKNVIRIK